MKRREAHDLLKQFSIGDVVDVTYRGIIVGGMFDKTYDNSEKDEHCYTDIDVLFNTWTKPDSIDCIDLTDYGEDDTLIQDVPYKIVSVVKVNKTEIVA